MAGYEFCPLRVDFMDIAYRGNTEQRTGDTALVHIFNVGTDAVNYTWQNAQCYKCPVFWTTMPPGSNCTQRVQTNYGNVVKVGATTTNASLQSCGASFVDTGEYRLDLSSNGSCVVTTTHDPPNPDLPVLYAFLFYLGIAILWIILNQLYRRGVFTPLLRPLLTLLGHQPTEANTSKIESDNTSHVRTSQTIAIVDGNINNSESNNSTEDSNGIEVISHRIEADSSSTENIKDNPSSIGDEPFTEGATAAAVVTSAAAAGSHNDILDNTRPSSAAKPQLPIKSSRLVSLDAFRGLCLSVMIFVNYGGAGYWYFEHAPWNGLTVADTVFPWFIWMMGTSMIFSFKGLLRRNTSMRSMIWKIVWRSAKLFAIGLSLATKGNNDLSRLRIPGILQRFGLVYLVSALAYLPWAHRTNVDNVRMFDDIVLFWPEWLIHIALLAVYLALTFALPVPGCPRGYLGPGGLAEGGVYRYCTGGAAGYADRALFTEAHIYNYPTSAEIYYSSQAFDPEGFFTVIPTLLLCLLGSQAGKIIAMHKSRLQILPRWISWAILTGALSLLLCHGNENEGWIPINKNLWSLSYIFAMAGTAFLLLSIMYLLIDVTKIWNGAPFIYPGMNSILIYICQSVFSQYFPVSWDMPDWTSHWQQLILCCWATSFWIFVAYVLHRKKIYLAL